MLALVVSNQSDEIITDIELFDALQKIKDPVKWNPDPAGLFRVIVREEFDPALIAGMSYSDIIYNIATGTDVPVRCITTRTDNEAMGDMTLTFRDKDVHGRFSQDRVSLSYDDLQVQKLMRRKYLHNALHIGKNTSVKLSHIAPKSRVTIYFSQTEML